MHIYQTRLKLSLAAFFFAFFIGSHAEAQEEGETRMLLNDILLLVVDRLDGRDFVAAKKVCKRWGSVCKDARLHLPATQKEFLSAAASLSTDRFLQLASRVNPKFIEAAIYRCFGHATAQERALFGDSLGFWRVANAVLNQVLPTLKQVDVRGLNQLTQNAANLVMNPTLAQAVAHKILVAANQEHAWSPQVHPMLLLNNWLFIQALLSRAAPHFLQATELIRREKTDLCHQRQADLTDNDDWDPDLRNATLNALRIYLEQIAFFGLERPALISLYQDAIPSPARAAFWEALGDADITQNLASRLSYLALWK